MARRLLTLICAVIWVSSLISGPGWCQSTRAKLLTELTLATNAQLTPRVKANLSSSPSDLKLLAIDLITYRWVTHASAATVEGRYPDLKNIDAIIKVISRESADPMVRWAEKKFDISAKGAAQVPAPPEGDKRGTMLTNLKEKFATALRYEESRPVESVNALKSALDSCVELQLEITKAQAISKLGDYYLYHARQFEQAKFCYNSAVWLFTTYGCVAASATVLDSLGLLNMGGNYSAASDNYLQSAQQWLQLAAQDPSGFRYRNLAGQQFVKSGDALRRSDPVKGLQLMTVYGLHQLQLWAYPTKSYALLITNRIKAARLYRDGGEISNALEQLRRAQKESDVCGDQLLRAQTYNELSKTYAADNNEAKAADMAREATRILKVTSSIGDSAISKLAKDPSRKDLLQKAESGAIAYRELGELQNAVNIWKALAAIYQRLGLIEQRVASMESLAAIYDERGQRTESLTVRFDAAMSAWKANKVTLAAGIVEGMVMALIDIGDLNNALEAFTELQPIIEASGDVRGAASMLAARGVLMASNGQPGKAINFLEAARTRYMDPEQVGDAWAAADVSIQLAGAQVAANRPDEARSILDATVKYIEKKFADEIIAPNADSEHGPTLLNLYHDLASLDITTGKPDEAKKLIERAAVRYMWTLELINRLKKSNNPEVAKFASQAADIVGQSSIDYQPGKEGNRQELLARNWGEFSGTCWMLRKQQCPAAYNALPVNPLELFRLRAKLPTDAAVVTYIVTSNTVYALVCSRNQAVCWRLSSSAASVTASVAELRSELENCERSLDGGVPIPAITDWNSPSFTSIAKPLSSLYNQLLGPIRDNIAGKRLLVFALPDELMGVPMHALVRYQDDSQPHFLIQDYQVSYLSEGMLDSFIAKDSATIDPVADKLTILADPENNLPGAQDEAKTIKAIYTNSKWFIGDKATVSCFISESRTANIMHIAAHQVVDLNPTNSFTLLLASDANSAGSLGLQELSKVQNEKLKLVVLSACNVLSTSDPISSGASRASEIFAQAGAKSVMGGLWKVSDGTASGLMASFYRQINKKWPKAEALQYAQTRMIESGQFAHPFYWACFALHGNPW